MRVLHVVRRFDPLLGGTERYVGDLARAQAAAGHEVTVVTLDRDVAGVHAGRLPPHEAAAGVEIIRLPGFGTARFAATLRPDRLIRLVRRAEVVHLHDLRFHVGASAIAARLSARRSFLHTHGLIFSTRRWRRVKELAFRTYYEPVLLTARTDVLCSSVADLEMLRRVAPRLARHATALPNGVELAPFLTLDRSPHPGRIVIAGRVTPSKGHDRTITALATIRAQPWVLEIHGAADVGEVERLSSLAARLDIGDRVTFHGPFSPSEEPAILREATLALFPSRAEGFGIALLDAMAAGVPLLASDIPAHRALLGADMTTRLVDFDDPYEAGRAIAAALEIEASQASVAAARARERAGQFDIGRLVAALEDRYRPSG